MTKSSIWKENYDKHKTPKKQIQQKQNHKKKTIMTAIVYVCVGGGGGSCRFTAAPLRSGNFPRGNQWENRDHLLYVLPPPYCKEIILYKPPTSAGAALPWPSPRSTCYKASQFAAYFVLDIKAERVRPSENNLNWHIHEFQWKNKQKHKSSL